MRIAYVTYEYPPFIIGGAGVYAYHVTKELAKLGHQIFVFTPSISGFGDDGGNESNLKIRRIPINDEIPFKSLQFWLRLPRVIKEEERKKRFDIIHFNGSSYLFLKRRIASAPIVLTIHHLVNDAIMENPGFFSRLIDIHGETSLFLSLIEERSIRSADKIIAVSNFTRDQITQKYSIAADMIDVVYCGGTFYGSNFSQEDLEEIRNQYSIRDVPIILFVGRVNDYRKGLDILVKSFEQVLKTVDATLLVVGKIDTVNPHYLIEQLREKIIFTGYVDNETLQKFYAICDVYVSPSRLEGFGLTIIEAFAAGKTVVATNVGAIPELIQHGENGSLVALNDSEGMAEAIIFYLKDPSLSKMIGENNKKYLQNSFSWEECAKKLDRIYRNL